MCSSHIILQQEKHARCSRHLIPQQQKHNRCSTMLPTLWRNPLLPTSADVNIKSVQIATYNKNVETPKEFALKRSCIDYKNFLWFACCGYFSSTRLAVAAPNSHSHSLTPVYGCLLIKWHFSLLWRVLILKSATSSLRCSWKYTPSFWWFGCSDSHLIPQERLINLTAYKGEIACASH